MYLHRLPIRYLHCSLCVIVVDLGAESTSHSSRHTRAEPEPANHLTKVWTNLREETILLIMITMLHLQLCSGMKGSRRGFVAGGQNTMESRCSLPV